MLNLGVKMKTINLDTKLLDVIALYWSEGTPYEPAGYYAIVRLTNSLERGLHQILVRSDPNPPEQESSSEKD